MELPAGGFEKAHGDSVSMEPTKPEAREVSAGPRHAVGDGESAQPEAEGKTLARNEERVPEGPGAQAPAGAWREESDAASDATEPGTGGGVGPSDSGLRPSGDGEQKEPVPPEASGESVTGGAAPSSQSAPPPSASTSEDAPEAAGARPAGAQPETDFYFVKWISWRGERTPIITQNENGPCPLLAIMNILFLRWKVTLPPQKEVITSEELMALLGDCFLSIKPQEQSEALQLNFQQNVSDAMTVLPKLSTGLDVNVRFTGVSDFEYTPECIVFDLLNIPLYHGWLPEPQGPEVLQAVGKLSYNQLVEKIITCKHSSDTNLVTEGLIAEQFLESTAAQLTYHGLCELMATVTEGELSVFFRNNHFSTMIKHKGHLYLLVTDQGFLQEEKVTWESLHNVEGDSCFCDSEFHLSHHLEKDAACSSSQQLQQRQVDQDYMIALSLQQQQQGPPGMSDLELARQLQQEEYQAQQQQPQPPPQRRAQTSGRQSSEQRQRHKSDSDCVLL
ncbi:ubiquitin carboxyl-terminal hydrolase MINDY-1 [Rhinatrema bivittatum]|uniref:ubiquitin carboxyl-terminal hydrolase MINDY-1 n=1 Tax=Rhinatrema bivittatum TaxID=194408 RepID=UPI00112D475A|nr:ubiquitin carboxyl-terminal hydrolase MINDY-1 [Rhinatrema bivittatum]XP_029436430.1 ubiquitin carboxyl-terminal hydrolase MINDY-1 [Rhinatrema bivittatum]XP_029436431.1 ubiquitin carboxyl-terminal hydrolase MINDY-1 [Rhinatrema bivittatum]XP_029436433.1 ubiquitin carboxyl-terminal hydrolase MINDY-1 [Rhinatrema bivittatum]XP_029436434.1 ubiquitin carboxyl-terminal hydrolase MINDY-1 [Rhinatrema bivittatum]